MNVGVTKLQLYLEVISVTALTQPCAIIPQSGFTSIAITYSIAIILSYYWNPKH